MGSFSIPWPFGKGKTARGITNNNQRAHQEDDEAHLEEFGVTQQLCDYVRGFTINTFKDYPLQDGQKGQQIDGSASNVSKDLTEWQERHATLVLSKVKEISQLRYVLCPRHLKERQFWRIYFLLVKSYISPYEIRALTKARLRILELQNKKSIDTAAIEVEMTDAKHASGSSVALQCDSELLVEEDRGELHAANLADAGYYDTIFTVVHLWGKKANKVLVAVCRHSQSQNIRKKRPPTKK